ncbi:Translin [Clavulina sp. PMI_390]|nr:Translin [Clavulina sp. PMI_390]
MDINIEELREHLEQEAVVREKIRDEANNFEKATRLIVGHLNTLHSTPPSQISDLVSSAKPLLLSCREHTAQISECVPPHQFWRWKETWTRTLQTAVFAAALIEFLDSGRLISMATVNELLGIDATWKDRLYLQVEDYLHGLITLINELSRLAVNMVTMGDFNGPFKISEFVRDLFAGFSLLNLKNDSLRRRFDSIKYDMKRIEEVVYDITLRKLRPERDTELP